MFIILFSQFFSFLRGFMVQLVLLSFLRKEMKNLSLYFTFFLKNTPQVYILINFSLFYLI